MPGVTYQINHALAPGWCRLSRASAGIILAGTFSVLTTFPLLNIFQLGFTVMLGILIDTFIVRAIMVPAIVMKLGELNWWPSKTPRADYSGSTVDADAPL